LWKRPSVERGPGEATDLQFDDYGAEGVAEADGIGDDCVLIWSLVMGNGMTMKLTPPGNGTRVKLR